MTSVRSTTRRNFLKTTLGAATLVSLGPAAPGFLCRAAMAEAPQRADRDTILVVVQLAGGNDGLNTVVPYENDLYAANRRTLRLTASEVLKIGDSLGLHPQMKAFEALYKEGYLTVVQGVGYPNPVGGHAESMHMWQTGRPHEVNCQVGWVGRVVDQVADADRADVPALFVGQINRPLTLNAQRANVPAVGSPAECLLHSPPGPLSAPEHRRRLDALAELPRPATARPLEAFLQQGTLAACAGNRRIEAAAQAQASGGAGAYPDLELAHMFRLVAQLIRADLGIRIFCTELGGEEPGGFDNHAGQRDNHAALLHQLSESVAAFLHDLKRDNLLDRVLLFTFSEFGRTLYENGRRGTDHGSAAPMFLAGGKLKGGLVGAHPSLTVLENGGPQHHTDFRRVYATALDRWLGWDSQPVLGAKFEPLDVLKA